jgi:hypothetical protein
MFFLTGDENVFGTSDVDFPTKKSYRAFLNGYLANDSLTANLHCLEIAQIFPFLAIGNSRTNYCT